MLPERSESLLHFLKNRRVIKFNCFFLNGIKLWTIDKNFYLSAIATSDKIIYIFIASTKYLNLMQIITEN